MLVVSGHLQMGVTADHSLGGRQVSVDQLQQRGLARPVGPHQREPGVQVHAELQVLVDVGGVLAVAEADVLDHDDGGRDLPARVEAEGDAVLRGHLLREPARHHLGQSLLLRLGLSRELRAAVTEPDIDTTF